MKIDIFAKNFWCMKKLVLALFFTLSVLTLKAGDWESGERNNSQYVASVADGSFDNLAVKDCKLKSLVMFNLDKEGNLCLYLTLYEYGQYAVVTNEESVDYKVTAQIEGKVVEFVATHSSKLEDITFCNADALTLAKALSEGKDVSMTVKIDSNSYQVSIDSEGFYDQYKIWLSA